MSDGRPYQRPVGKPPAIPGISLSDFGQVKSRVDRLDKIVEAHAVALQEKNTWNALIREWIGKSVTVETRGGEVCGTLLWVDRYTLCIHSTGERYTGKKIIVNKSALQIIYET